MYGEELQGYEPERNEGGYQPSKYSHNNPQNITLEEIDLLTMADYGLSPSAVKAYMFGLSVTDPRTNKPIGDEFYENAIQSAMAQVEQELDIAIFPRLEVEHQDYHSENFNSYMYTHVYKRPIIQVENLKMEMSGRGIYSYPSKWWTVYNLSGHIEIMPTPLMQSGNNFMGGSVYPYPVASVIRPGTGKTFAPQMIHVEYIAGLLPRKHGAYNRQWEMPATLEKMILKVAVREIFQLWGRLLIQPGLASTSISMDGISQSMGTTQSAMYGAVSADITQINADIAELKKALKGYFGSNFITV